MFALTLEAEMCCLSVHSPSPLISALLPSSLFPLHITSHQFAFLHMGCVHPRRFWCKRQRDKRQRYSETKETAATPKFPCLVPSPLFFSFSSAVSHFVPSPRSTFFSHTTIPPNPLHSTLHSCINHHVRILFRQPGRWPQLRGTFLDPSSLLVVSQKILVSLTHTRTHTLTLLKKYSIERLLGDHPRQSLRRLFLLERPSRWQGMFVGHVDG